MFGNSELKETKLKLDIAINVASKVLTGIDPLMRPIFLKEYKTMIEDYDRIRDRYTFTSDIPYEHERKYVEENKEVISVLRKIVKKVENDIATEEFEGSTYAYASGLGVPHGTFDNKNSLFNRLLKLLNEEFPGIYRIDEDDKKDLVTNKEDNLLSNISDEKSLELKASQIISELTTEDDETYEGEFCENEEEELEEEIIKGEFGTPKYPTDIKAFYKSIFFHLMSRQVALNQQGTQMTDATRLSIQLICDYVTPDENDDELVEKFSPELLLSFKRRIAYINGLIEWMDSKMPLNLDRLKIGKTENDCYRTQQEFIDDIDPNEIVDIVRHAWIDSKDEEMMKKIRPFEKQVKENWIDE